MERAELAERRQELEIEDGILERDYRFFDRVQGTDRLRIKWDGFESYINPFQVFSGFVSPTRRSRWTRTCT